MKALRLIFNKYLIATAVFIVWVGFFDQNDWLAQKEQKDAVRAGDQAIDNMKSDIARMVEEYRMIRNDTFTLEKTAREKYRMKRDGEDLYVVEDKKAE
jgi:cell division protein FtsB